MPRLCISCQARGISRVLARVLGLQGREFVRFCSRGFPCPCSMKAVGSIAPRGILRVSELDVTMVRGFGRDLPSMGVVCFIQWRIFPSIYLLGALC